MLIRTHYLSLLSFVLLMTTTFGSVSAAPTPFEILTGTGEGNTQATPATAVTQKTVAIDQANWDRFMSVVAATMKDSAVKEAVAKMASAKTAEEKRMAQKEKNEAIKNAMVKMVKSDPSLLPVIESLSTTSDRLMSALTVTTKDSAVKEAVAKMASAKTAEEKRMAQKEINESTINAIAKSDPSLLPALESLNKVLQADKKAKPTGDITDHAAGNPKEPTPKAAKKAGIPRPDSIDSVTWKRFIDASKTSATDPAVVAAKNLINSAKGDSERKAAIKSYNETYRAGILKVDPAFSAVFKAIDEAKAKPEAK